MILFSFIEYVEKNYIIDAVFVTYNTDDFCLKKDGKFSLHPDLIQEFKRSYSVFYNASGEAINNINKNIDNEIFNSIREEIIESEMEELLADPISESCQLCSHAIDFIVVELDSGKEIKDPNQLQFDFVKFIEIRKLSNPLDRLMVAECSYCDTDYFICAACGFINIVEYNDYDVRKECAGYLCNLPYYISSEYGHWDYIHEMYIKKYSVIN